MVQWAGLTATKFLILIASHTLGQAHAEEQPSGRTEGKAADHSGHGQSDLSENRMLETPFSFLFPSNHSNKFINTPLPRSIRIYGQRPSLLRPSLFHVVKFPNDECYDASNQSGTCYTPLECKAFGGTGSSTCAKGYGVCCIISRSCHNVTSQKVVYFKNPSYPQADNQQNYCDLTVEIKDTNVCQLRLDFLDFQLDQPKNGNCMDDKLTVTASGVSTKSIPVLCGKNNNQHMYVHLDRANIDRSASILFKTNSIGPYRWHVRVTQIDCSRSALPAGHSGDTSTQGQSDHSFTSTSTVTKRRIKRKIPFLQMATLKVSIPAPTGCLQFFTQSSGIVESFNFGQYLNNMDYAICIERQPSTCKIIYSASDYEWNLDKYGGQKTVAGVGDMQCVTDYLLIPGGSATGYGQTFDRFCGGKLNYLADASTEAKVVSKASGPIVLRFRSDNQQDWDMKEGFRLRYEQSHSNCEEMYSTNTATSGQASNTQPSPYFQAGVASSVQASILAANAKESRRRTDQARFNAKKWSSY
ncbi:hypothetical protein HDE_08035 [Halotydeus destructor]|nr:hypothetical protein HDE_08035 [Halotydeus destructor]